MCGICGEFIFNGRDRIQQGVVDAMRDALSIVDLTTRAFGQIPMGVSGLGIGV